MTLFDLSTTDQERPLSPVRNPWVYADTLSLSGTVGTRAGDQGLASDREQNEPVRRFVNPTGGVCPTQA